MKKMLGVIAMVLAMSGCYNAEIPGTVVLAGDSLMQSMSGTMGFKMLHNDKAPMLINNSMGGMFGMAMESGNYWHERLSNIRDITEIDYVFVSLGINDIGYYRQQEDGANMLRQEVPSAIDGFMSALSLDTEVYWLVPHTGMYDSSLDSPEIGIMRNELALAERRWANLHLHYIDDKPQLLDTDNIHLNSTGSNQVSAYFVGQLEGEL